MKQSNTPYVIRLKCYMKQCGKEWTGIFPDGFNQSNLAECPECRDFTGEIESIELKGIVSLIYKKVHEIGHKQWSEYALKMDSLELYNDLKGYLK